MRINTNIEAMNAHRQLQQTNRDMQTTLERLSSGQRINRAADDAAGLSISEKMTGQVNGLNQAVSNAQDAISLIQTAEGALEESHSILQRMRELAVQSANDTNIDDDRGAIQDEMDQLAAELSRIAENTEFNTQELVDGTFEGIFHIGANEGQNIDLEIGDMRAGELGVEGLASAEFEVDAAQDDLTEGDGQTDYAIEDGVSYDVVEIEGTPNVDGPEGIEDLENVTHGLADEDGNIVAVSDDQSDFHVLQEAAAEDELDTAELAASNLDETQDPDAYQETMNIDFEGYEVPVESSVEVALGMDNGTLDTIDATASIEVELENVELDAGTYEVAADEDTDSDYVLQLDEETEAYGFIDGEEVNWHIDDDADSDLLFTTADIGEGEEIEITEPGGLAVETQEDANDAIAVIDDAIDQVSEQRSELGALQNRLEHTISNLSVASENLSAAESRIRDADMASEMMEFSRQQVLEEAGTAMMAQANMQPQTVLQLLQ